MNLPTGADAYILFTVAGTTYALSSEEMRHMEMIEQITPVPNAAPYLEGVVLSRGQIVPVLNLRARFGFERVPHDLRTRLLVLESGDRWVGLVVDSAREFVRIPSASIQPPSNAITGLSADYLRGITTLDGRLVLVLDAASVLDTSTVPNAAAADGAVLGGRDDQGAGPDRQLQS
jgi:purine-binding chemotaxis protein CheW